MFLSLKLQVKNRLKLATKMGLVNYVVLRPNWRLWGPFSIRHYMMACWELGSALKHLQSTIDKCCLINTILQRHKGDKRLITLLPILSILKSWISSFCPSNYEWSKNYSMLPVLLNIHLQLFFYLPTILLTLIYSYISSILCNDRD